MSGFTLMDLFSHEDAAMPDGSRDGADYEEYLDDVLGRYENLMARLAPVPDLNPGTRGSRQQMKDFARLQEKDPLRFATQLASLKADRAARTKANLAQGIRDAVACWLKGAPSEAMDALRPALDDFWPKISCVSGSYFRARLDLPMDERNRAGAFHTPFEHRDRVATQRFSFPGLPCLYLSSSLYGCWLELGEPDLSRMWVTRYHLDNLSLLDLAVRPADLVAAMKEDMSAGYTERFHNAAYFAAIWPLAAACAIPRPSSRSTNFVVEYIIPQLVLQWVRERKTLDATKDVWGVKFQSTLVGDRYGQADLLQNIVLPARVQTPKGQCVELGSKLPLTEPLSWQLALATMRADPAEKTPNFSAARLDQEPNRKTHFVFRPETRFPYGKTHFGCVERFLEREELGRVL